MTVVRKNAGWLLLAVLTLFSLWLRLWQSGTIPPGLHFDEAAYGLIANTIRGGNFGVFYSEFTGREPIYMYAVALSQLFFGQTVFAERLPAALNGVTLILASFWCFREMWAGEVASRGDVKSRRSKVEGREVASPASPVPSQEQSSIVNRQSSILMAWLVALMVAFCFWNLHLSREGYRANTPPLFIALAFAACWRAARLQTRKWAIIAGILSGLTLYTYLSARFVPFVFVGFALYFLVFYWFSWRKLPDFRRLTRNHLKLIGFGVLFFGLTVAPLATHFALHRGDFFQRSAQISIFSPENGGAVAKLSTNLIDAFKMISIAGTRDMKYNLTGRPVFDWLSAALFYIGLLICIWQARRRPVYGFLLIWLLVMFLPTLLSEAGNNPLRSFGAMPAVMGVWAVGVVGVWAGLTRVVGRRGWYAGLALAALALLITFASAYTDYFDKWAKSDELYTAFETDYTDLAGYLAQQPAGRNTVIAAELLDYPSIVYLAPNATGYGWSDISKSLIVPQGVSNLDYIVPNRAWASGELRPDWYKVLNATPTIEKISNPAGRELGQHYRFKLPADFEKQLAMTPVPCAVPVNFNDDIVLLGYRLNSPPQVGQPLALTLFWRAKRPASVNYQIFVHLVDRLDSDKKFGQQDANGAFSQGWQAGDLIVGQYNFIVDPQTKPGKDYLLAIGLYNVDDRRQTRAPLLTDCPQVNAAKNAYYIPGIQIR